MAHFLVLGATGGTGQRFVTHALAQGDTVRALVRTPAKLPAAARSSANLEVIEGSMTDTGLDVSGLIANVDYVVCMVGDRGVQATTPICCDFIKRLVPAMRERGVQRLYYQAGGFSRPHGGYPGWSAPILWAMRHTIVGQFDGQHRDNEMVMEYLATECGDIEWMVHRAGIDPGSGDTSKGTLRRTASALSIGTFQDCAVFNYQTVLDTAAVRTTHCSQYQ